MDDRILAKAKELFDVAIVDRPYTAAMRGLANPYNNKLIDNENDYLDYLCSLCLDIAEKELSKSPEEKLLHVCPSCGTFTPVEQRVCDCGYHFDPISQTPPANAEKERGGRRPQTVLARVMVATFSTLIVVLIAAAIWQGFKQPDDPVALDPAPSASSQLTSAPSASPSQTTTPIATPTPAKVPPQSGRVFYMDKGWSSLTRIAPFTIETSGTDDYYIKLVDISSLSGARRGIEFYLRGGDTLDIDVPLGIYELRYATGPDWYGEDLLFGSKTSYHKADDTFVFYEDDDGTINGWTVELYLQANGNLSTETISAEEF